MPRRKKRNKAAIVREEKKRFDSETDTVNNVMPSTLQNIPSNINCCVVSGTIHQGDLRFQYPGVQCTFISFWALVLMENKSPLLWNRNDIDLCIIDGNERFLEHCINIKSQPRQLLVRELPQSINAYGTLIQLCQLDSDIKVGTLNQSSNSTNNAIFTSIEEAISRCFDQFNSCFLVCGGQTIAIAKREDIFFVFDSHSRGNDGLVHHTGNSVLVSFTEIEVLIGFIKELFIESLLLRPSEQFELVPVIISKQENANKEDEKTSCIVNPGPNTELEMFSEEPDITNPIAFDSCSVQIEKEIDLHERDMQSYFTDQRKRDTDYRQTTIQNNDLDNSKHASRKEYMRTYMQKRRDDDSFRKKGNEVSLKSVQKLRRTEEGRQRLKNESAERKKRMLSSEKGRQRHNKQSVEGMRKILSTEEGRQKHNKQAFKTMKKVLSTDEGRQKHNMRSVEGMKKMLNTEGGRQKHNMRSAEWMKKMLSTEEGKQKHNMRSVEGMKKMLSTEEGRQKHNMRSVEGMKKMLSTEEGRET